jgi:hypothetical protein
MLAYVLSQQSQASGVAAAAHGKIIAGYSQACRQAVGERIGLADSIHIVYTDLTLNNSIIVLRQLGHSFCTCHIAVAKSQYGFKSLHRVFIGDKYWPQGV